jgi:hypothetical protein
MMRGGRPLNFDRTAIRMPVELLATVTASSCQGGLPRTAPAHRVANKITVACAPGLRR